MSYYNQNQLPVGVGVGVGVPPRYPPEGYPKDAYPPPGYPPPPYGQPPPQQQQSSGPCCMEGWEKARKIVNANATYEHSATVMKKGGLTFRGRKPLSDISNRNQTSRNKQNRKLTSRKKQNRKLSAVTEELFHEKDIAYELDVHNHEECIKAKHQEMAMEMDDFLKFVGLANGCPKELPSLQRPESPPPRSPPRLLEEMWEPITRFVPRTPSPPKLTDDDH